MASGDEKIHDVNQTEPSSTTNDYLEKVESSRYEQDIDTKQDGDKRLDYSGAHAKTDPAEIALVKKLDWYIMPMLWLVSNLGPRSHQYCLTSANHARAC